MRFRVFFRFLLAALFLAGTLTAAGLPEWDGVTGEPPPPDLDPAATAATGIYGPVLLVHDERAFVGGVVRVDFDDAAHHDAVNTRYILEGLRFNRDDGERVHAYDFCGCKMDTSSVPNVACTTRGPGARSIANHLNIVFDSDTYAAGFTLGNDTVRSMVFTIELFDSDDRPIASFPVIGNCNGDCDEFVGLISLEPFRRLRVSHNLRSRAVCVDDVVYSGRRVIAP